MTVRGYLRPTPPSDSKQLSDEALLLDHHSLCGTVQSLWQELARVATDTDAVAFSRARAWAPARDSDWYSAILWYLSSVVRLVLLDFVKPEAQSQGEEIAGLSG